MVHYEKPISQKILLLQPNSPAGYAPSRLLEPVVSTSATSAMRGDQAVRQSITSNGKHRSFAVHSLAQRRQSVLRSGGSWIRSKKFSIRTKKIS